LAVSSAGAPAAVVPCCGVYGLEFGIVALGTVVDDVAGGIGFGIVAGAVGFVAGEDATGALITGLALAAKAEASAANPRERIVFIAEFLSRRLHRLWKQTPDEKPRSGNFCLHCVATKLFATAAQTGILLGLLFRKIHSRA
jgi:hypothetical protein